MTQPTTPYQVMPPLTADEYAELEDSIRISGVLVPVVVDERGVIIDGYNRSEIADRRGVDCPRQVREGLTDAQKRSLAFELNLNRRHLNREQKRQLVAESLKADPQLSDREHARRTGVSHPTVAAVRRELEQTGDVENLSTRTDTLGREQPVPEPDRPETDEEFLARWRARWGARPRTTITIPQTWEETLAVLVQMSNDERRFNQIWLSQIVELAKTEPKLAAEQFQIWQDNQDCT